MKKIISIALLLSCSTISIAQDLDGFTANSQQAERDIERQFLETVNFDSFKNHLKALTVKPHVSGNKANEDVRDYMAKVMSDAGWDVELYPYDIYMSKEPGVSIVALVTPVRQPLNQQENIVKEDPFSADPTLWKGWNAYSGSGDVTSEVVYANYGTIEDFEKLKELGINTKGKIIMARYGGNFRGFKAKFAEASGAAGLLIFTDPKDSGYARGLAYPEGPYSNESTIQRGSILAADFTGDPLTPFEPALLLDGKKKIKRIDPKNAQLHTIPVTPISYGAAQEILEKMQGAPVPVEW